MGGAAVAPPLLRPNGPVASQQAERVLGSQLTRTLKKVNMIRGVLGILRFD